MGFCWPRYSCKIRLCMLMEAQITEFTKPSLQMGLKTAFCDFNVSPLHPPTEKLVRFEDYKEPRASQMACPPETWQSGAPG